jgi:hypothetical protein
MLGSATVADAQSRSKKGPPETRSDYLDAGQRAQNKMDAQNKRWDADMRRITRSVCRGC